MQTFVLAQQLNLLRVVCIKELVSLMLTERLMHYHWPFAISRAHNYIGAQCKRRPAKHVNCL